jgi:acetylglutamate kinase
MSAPDGALEAADPHLLEALPYIREFHGRTVVIKYGGAAMSQPALREEFARDVVLLKYVGINPIVVHGGGPDITRYMEKLRMPVEFVGGLRVSDAETVEIAKMVLVGKVNKDIVMRLNRHGQPAVWACAATTARCSASPARRRRAGETSGSWGRFEKGWRRHPRAHRRGLHPRHRLGRRGPDGRVAQRQRRRGGGRRSPARWAPTRCMFLHRRGGWLRDRPTRGPWSPRATADAVEAAMGTIAGGCAPSSRPASTRSTAG